MYSGELSSFVMENEKAICSSSVEYLCNPKARLFVSLEDDLKPGFATLKPTVAIADESWYVNMV